MFDTILGLPVHPLVVHAPVVLLPLVAVALILLAFRPAWRSRFAIPVLVLLAIGSLGTVVAMLSGNALGERVGIPATHQTYGVSLVISSLVFLVVAGGWLVWTRRSDEPTGAQQGLGWVVALGSVGIIVLTGLVGHSGATAAWSDVVATQTPQPTTSEEAEPGPAASPADSPAATATPTTGTSDQASPTPSQPTGYTMDDVAQHATRESCWAAVDGDVYDLTQWIALHPGGEDRILGLCGTDASAAFRGQHSDQGRPNDQLASMLLGPLVG